MKPGGVAWRLVPVVFSLLVLVAHFLRAGNVVLGAAVLVTVVLLAVPRRWAALTVQVALLVGTVEWIRTLVQLASWRMQTGQPYVRMVVILGCVALVSGLSALVFRSSPMRHRYAPGPQGPA